MLLAKRAKKDFVEDSEGLLEDDFQTESLSALDKEARLPSAVRAIAKFITNVGAPPFTFLLASIFLALQPVDEAPSLSLALKVGMIGGLAPLGVLVVLRLMKTIETLDLSTFRERIIGFGLAIGFGVFLLASLEASSRSLTLSTFLYAHIIATGIFFLATIYTMRFGWKLSVHSGGVASLLFIGLFCFGKAALVWGSLCVLAVCWSRICLGRHTLQEVVFGVVLGFGTYAAVFKLAGI